MSFILLCLILLSFFGFFGCLIWLVVSFFTKTPKKFPIISLIVSVVVFFISAPTFAHLSENTTSPIAGDSTSNSSGVADNTEETTDDELTETEYSRINDFELEREEEWLEEEKEKWEDDDNKDVQTSDNDYDNIDPADYDTGITYDDLARNPDDNKFENVTLSGTIIQVLEGSSSSQYRLAVDDDYNNIVLIDIPEKLLDSRVLEDDILTIYGESEGTVDYESTMGGNITVPFVSVDKFETNGQAE